LSVVVMLISLLALVVLNSLAWAPSVVNAAFYPNSCYSILLSCQTSTNCMVNGIPWDQGHWLKSSGCPDAGTTFYLCTCEPGYSR
jgi:hypothetical protein